MQAVPKMLHSRYVSLERERLAQEYLDLRQGSKSVMKITKMSTERAMFCPDFVASKQAQMTRYLSMLKTEIRKFVSIQRYCTLLEIQ